VKIRHVIGILVSAAAAGSCSLDVPTETNTINVFLDLEKGYLPVGDSVRIRVIVSNVGFEPVSLTGPSDCLLYTEVVDNQGTVLWHSNTNCVGSIVTESVVVGVDRTQSFMWNGTNLAGARLTGGFYLVIGAARLSGTAYRGPAVSISLE
jgi:hypothetical protein